MRVCGVEIKSNEARFVVLEGQAGSKKPQVVQHGLRKIKLEEDDDQRRVQDFFRLFSGMVRDQRIDMVLIKKRNKKGEYAGGPVTFKLEGLIQLISECHVSLTSPVTIASFKKKNPLPLPNELMKYQQAAFDLARMHFARSEE